MDAVEARATLGWMQNPVRGLLHGSAALLSIAGTGALWIHAEQDLFERCALLVFGSSLVCLYGVSSAYHAVPWSPAWKSRMQRVDHAMIYVLIAGTYTPSAAIVLDGPLRVAALATAWGITLVGVAQKLWWPRVGHGYSIALQVVQGWLGALLVLPLSERLGWSAVALLILGGLLYTLGMIAFATQRPRLWPRLFSYHEVFHVLVVAGSAVHYTMTFVYVAPLSAI